MGRIATSIGRPAGIREVGRDEGRILGEARIGAPPARGCMGSSLDVLAKGGVVFIEATIHRNGAGDGCAPCVPTVHAHYPQQRKDA